VLESVESKAQARPGRPDRLIFWVAVCLLGFGAIMVFSASAHLAAEHYKVPFFFFLKQFLFFCVGFAILLGASHIPYHFWHRSYRLWTVLGVALLLAVLFMPEVRGARRWLFVGPLSLQASEGFRFGMVLFLAATWARLSRQDFSFKRNLLPQVVLLGAGSLLIMLQPDFGSVLLLTGTFIVLMFLAGLPLRHLAALTLPAVAFACLLVLVFGYKQDRLDNYVTGLVDPFSAGYQVKQGAIYMGSGGLAGRGLGGGMAKFLYVPDAHTDFILAAAGEELGLFATLAITSAYLLFCVRGLRIASRAPDRFAALLVAGLVITLGLQAAINISVVLALIPPTGLPLPLMSYGGSSVLFTTLALAVILNVSRHAKR
jgi:cell division protein FtsW